MAGEMAGRIAGGGMTRLPGAVSGKASAEVTIVGVSWPSPGVTVVGAPDSGEVLAGEDSSRCGVESGASEDSGTRPLWSYLSVEPPASLTGAATGPISLSGELLSAGPVTSETSVAEKSDATGNSSWIGSELDLSMPPAMIARLPALSRCGDSIRSAPALSREPATSPSA